MSPRCRNKSRTGRIKILFTSDAYCSPRGEDTRGKSIREPRVSRGENPVSGRTENKQRFRWSATANNGRACAKLLRKNGNRICRDSMRKKHFHRILFPSFPGRKRWFVYQSPTPPSFHTPRRLSASQIFFEQRRNAKYGK